jgi:hypothetical protein
VAISLHLLLLISKTTKRPTTSEFLQLFRTSAKFFQSAFFAILYQALRDAPHSLCLAVASLIAFRLTIRMTDLRILRSLSQVENDVSFGLAQPYAPGQFGLVAHALRMKALGLCRRFSFLF